MIHHNQNHFFAIGLGQTLHKVHRNVAPSHVRNRKWD
jgi:hypothetical protein